MSIPGCKLAFCTSGSKPKGVDRCPHPSTGLSAGHCGPGYDPFCDISLTPDGSPAVPIQACPYPAPVGRGHRGLAARRAGTSRLAYEQFLIDCDRAAAYIFNDENAARRAADLKRHTAAVRILIARQQRRAHRDTVVLLAEQRARFVENRRRPTDRA